MEVGTVSQNTLSSTSRDSCTVIVAPRNQFRGRLINAFVLYKKEMPFAKRNQRKYQLKERGDGFLGKMLAVQA